MSCSASLQPLSGFVTYHMPLLKTSITTCPAWKYTENMKIQPVYPKWWLKA